MGQSRLNLTFPIIDLAANQEIPDHLVYRRRDFSVHQRHGPCGRVFLVFRKLSFQADAVHLDPHRNLGRRDLRLRKNDRH